MVFLLSIQLYVLSEDLFVSHQNWGKHSLPIIGIHCHPVQIRLSLVCFLMVLSTEAFYIPLHRSCSKEYVSERLHFFQIFVPEKER